MCCLVVTGCQEPKAGEGTVVPAQTSEAMSTEGSEADVEPLFWVQSEIEDGEYTLSLGHRGEEFRGGDTIEPVAQISKGNTEISEAAVHSSLLAEDGETVIAEEQETVFKQKSADEPGHYGCGKLQVPKDAEKCVLRFRIQLPESDFESIYDVPSEAVK